MSSVAPQIEERSRPARRPPSFDLRPSTTATLFLKTLTSLRLTVILLAFGIVLVWVGTVAQADEGLYQAQSRYFKQWFVWPVTMFGHRVPIGLPGGYLLGTLLLINLTAAHIKRFQWTWKKLGIHLTHIGIVLLLGGQLATDLLSRETHMRIREGETKTFSEAAMSYELAFLSDAGANSDHVVAIPQRMLSDKAEIKHEKLPFTVRVKEFWPNSDLAFRAPMNQNRPPLTTNGVANWFDFHPASVTHDMDSKNIPTTLIELVSASGSLGTWVASGWAGDESVAESIWRSYAQQMGAQRATTINARLTQSQFVTVDGQQFRFILRPARVYNPFSMTLLKATHAVYQGTDIPKDFRSRVRIENPQRAENREVEIYMNNPLRYSGLTFFQAGMIEKQRIDAGETPWTILQVVRNPGWLTPYASCIVVAAGLVTQFMSHLTRFLKRRAA